MLLKPIVLVGGGENHYRLIQSLNVKMDRSRPVILIAEDTKVFPKTLMPMVFGGLLSKREAQFDLWTVCQRTGVYFLEDQCININTEDRVLYLKRYGKLDYHKISLETDCQAVFENQDILASPSLFKNNKAGSLLGELQSFLAEVHRHCPREIRVVLSGLTCESLDTAFFLNQELKKSCEFIDILIVEAGFDKVNLEKRINKKIKKQLKDMNIRIVLTDAISSLHSHQVTLSEGTTFEFDIFVPFSHFQSQDFLGKLLQRDQQKIWVSRDLSWGDDKGLFVTGDNVQFKEENVRVSEIQKQQVNEVLLHNIFHPDEEAPSVTCRNQRRLWEERPFVKKNSMLSLLGVKSDNTDHRQWQEQLRVEVSQLKTLPLLEASQQSMKDCLEYEAQHMSRPWQGLVESAKSQRSADYRLISFNGFNSWGSYTQSTHKICEIAILKTIARGISPSRLRFNLTLPRGEEHLAHHIFESTFKAIEEVTTNHNIEIDGGDTFDGNYWHLMVTVGGEVFKEVTHKFEPHDYLLITRPLGFGFLWSSRMLDNFDSQWIQDTIDSSILSPFEQWKNFIDEFEPSATVLIEEWGFLYHCLQSLPSHQQLMVNFREVPRWKGIDQTLESHIHHPGLDINWQRIEEDVAFKRSEVSQNNSILWDSLSQGAMVVGVKAQQYKKALQALREMGYAHSTLVGCIRPKQGQNRVVLSDWTPQ